MSYNYNNNGYSYGNHQSQDQQETYYDPYAQPHRPEPYPSYDQSGYRDDYYQEGSGTPPSRQEKDQPFNSATLSAIPRENLNSKRYKYEQEGLWTRGGGLRSCGRFFCCTILIGVWMFIGIVLALVLYLRPPNVIIGDAQLPTTNPFQSVTNGFRINVEIPITVNNPSYLDVSLPKIDATIYYPINHTRIGNGTLINTSLPAHSNKTFTFPFSLIYSSNLDPSRAIFADLISKCGGSGDINVSYDLKVGVKVLAVTVSPSISNSVSFACPIDSSTLSTLAGSLNITNIVNGVTG